jgi:hypothetical protein
MPLGFARALVSRTQGAALDWRPEAGQPLVGEPTKFARGRFLNGAYRCLDAMMQADLKPV